ncbi:MAG: chemotaxis protein CheB [Pseudomonadota bacterium]|nr:chemotaxis protein CheB [Pseudomonadota bacterium]
MNTTAKGGATFAQDSSAEVIDMPSHAEKSGCIDFVLPIEKISVKLQKLATAIQRKMR